MGKNGEILRFQRAYHEHSDTIASYDFNLTPKSLSALHGVNGEAFEIYVSLPYCRTDDGQILITESLPDWQLLRDYFWRLTGSPNAY